MKSQILIHPEELSAAWIDRMAENGISVLGIHPWGGKHAVDSIRDLLSRLQTEEYRSLLDYAVSRGLSVEYEIHAAGYLMPREEFSRHPEYFRVNAGGQRTCDWNFCVSDPNALALVATRAADLACALYRSAPAFYFWMDDGKDVQCHCPSCRNLSASDQQMIVVNAMLTEIRKRIPNANMAYLAYYDTLSLPTKVSPVPGVFAEYAPFERYVAKGEGAADRIARERAALLPLLGYFGNKNVKVLEYWYDNSLFSGWKKPPKPLVPDVAALQRDIAYYRSLGIEYVSTFGCFLGEDYSALYGPPDISDFPRCLK